MDEKITLIKVNVIGEKFFHVFKMNDGSFQEVETTEEDYRQLGTKNPVNPTIEGGVWDSSFSRHKYDTIDGELGLNQYVESGGGKYNINLGDKLRTIETKEIVDDKISATLVASLSENIIETL